MLPTIKVMKYLVTRHIFLICKEINFTSSYIQLLHYITYTLILVKTYLKQCTCNVIFDFKFVSFVSKYNICIKLKIIDIHVVAL